MLYAMNTRTAVPTSNPSDNEFGHEVSGGVTFVYLRSTSGKGAVKVWATYGDPQLVIGQRVEMTNDTGNGHRWMADHIVIAVMTKDGIGGQLPPNSKIALWVAK